MTIKETYQTVLDRVNELNTNVNQHVSERAFINAFNKVQLHWLEERIKVAEANQVRQEEIQPFIETFSNGAQKVGDSLVLNLPTDYFRYSRVYGECSKDCEQVVHAYPREEGNAGRLLQDDLQRPSFEWAETFFTLKGNTLHFYADFDCSTITLIYYRCPVVVDMEDVGGSNIDPELTKTNLEEVIDLTALLVSGDTSNPRYQTIMNHIQQFN
jgi:hypothetical protein